MGVLEIVGFRLFIAVLLVFEDIVHILYKEL
jgi:hypothetical protein